MIVIIISSYIKAHILWNYIDIFIGILVIINMYSIIIIEDNYY